MNSSCLLDVSCEELYIGDSVSTVYDGFNKSKLRKVVLGKNVEYIRANAFSNANIQDFTVTGEVHPYCYPNIFGTVSNAILYVPEKEASYYQTTEPWTKFGMIKTLSGGTPSKPTACEKPTISFVDGSLVFCSSTVGAKYHCTIASPDMKSNVLCETGRMPLESCYNISVYATADGYTQSEITTATLYWVKADANLTPDNINSAKMRGIMVSANDGLINVSGLNDGELVRFYTIEGKILGIEKAVSGTASLSTNESVVICKMGDKSLKVLVK